MNKHVLLLFFVTLAILGGCSKPDVTLPDGRKIKETEVWEKTLRNPWWDVRIPVVANTMSSRLITTEDADRCFSEAGVDFKRKPFISRAAPGEFWVLYQVDSAIDKIDCTRYLLGR